MSDPNTKTYPLSAIMGGEISDKERIAELADAFNRVCDENADFVAQSVTDENRIAELEAQVKHCEGHAAELEAEVKTLRELCGRASDLIFDYCDVGPNNELGKAKRDSLFKAIDAVLWPERRIEEGK